MDMARLLKNSANFFMGISLATRVAGDLAAELRNSPYRTAGAAALLGVLTGIAVAHGRARRIIPTRK
jgi:hypothetical protein